MRIGVNMIFNRKIYLLLFVIIVLVIGLLILFKPSKISSGLHYLIASSNLSYTFYSFNGSVTYVPSNFSRFLSLPLGTKIPVKIEGQNIMLVNFSQFFAEHMPTGFIEKVALYSNTLLSPAGFRNYSTMILYAGNKVGDGDNIINVYASNGPLLIYTNGTDFYLEGGSFKVYTFLYGNITEMPYIIGIGTKLNSSVVSEGSVLFPVKFVPYLSGLVNNSSLPFVNNGTWWYGGYYVANIYPTSLPSGYYKFS